MEQFTQMQQIPFTVGNSYTRKDIYRILNVPVERQKGNWNTGYNKYERDWFIFCGLNTAGRTGHSYPNRFVGNDLDWYGNTHSKLSQPSIQSMIEPEGNMYIFTREDSNDPHFIYRGNARAKQFFDTTPVNIVWEFNDPDENHPEILAEEVVDPEKYHEGAVRQVTVNIYERNPDARKKCIDHYGLNCGVCGFNFYATYGEIGKDFIHVHHLVPLHEIKDEYEIDPIKDLRPVCPNCHAMLHKRRPAYTIEELKQIMGSYRHP